MPQVADLKIKPRSGGYPRSNETIEQILQAALRVLQTDGYAALTIGRVAAESGIRKGNITYHFPNKSLLVRELLEALLAGYLEAGERIRNPEADDRTILAAGVLHLLRDAQSIQATRLWPEIWAMAQHDKDVADWLEEFYRRGREPAIARVRKLNPDLTQEDAETFVVFLASVVEGSGLFAGHGKPFADRMPDLAVLVIEAILHLIETVTPERLRALREEWRNAPSDSEWIPQSLVSLTAR